MPSIRPSAVPPAWKGAPGGDPPTRTLRSEFDVRTTRRKPPKAPPGRRARSRCTPAVKPVPTPFAQSTSFANAKDDDKDLDVASVADIA